jgi:hypothetical protein
VRLRLHGHFESCSRAGNRTTWSPLFGRKFSGFQRELQFVVELGVAGIVVGEAQVIVASAEGASAAACGDEARDLAAVDLGLRFTAFIARGVARTVASTAEVALADFAASPARLARKATALRARARFALMRSLARCAASCAMFAFLRARLCARLATLTALRATLSRALAFLRRFLATQARVRAATTDRLVT